MKRGAWFGSMLVVLVAGTAHAQLQEVKQTIFGMD